MSKVYLVVRSGPEWNDVIIAFKQKQPAVKYAAELEAKREKSTDIFETLSTYQVSPINLVE